MENPIITSNTITIQELTKDCQDKALWSFILHDSLKKTRIANKMHPKLMETTPTSKGVCSTNFCIKLESCFTINYKGTIYKKRLSNNNINRSSNSSLSTQLL